MIPEYLWLSVRDREQTSNEEVKKTSYLFIIEHIICNSPIKIICKILSVIHCLFPEYGKVHT